MNRDEHQVDGPRVFLSLMLLIVVLGAFLTVMFASNGCGGSKITATDQSMVGSEAIQDTDCVVQNRGNRAKTDACRAMVKAFFDTYWSETFDAGKDAK